MYQVPSSTLIRGKPSWFFRLIGILQLVSIILQVLTILGSYLCPAVHNLLDWQSYSNSPIRTIEWMLLFCVLIAIFYIQIKAPTWKAIIYVTSAMVILFSIMSAAIPQSITQGTCI